MELLTKKQVAELLGVCCWTIDKWRCKERLPHWSIGRVIRFDRSAVLEWYDSFRKGGTVSESEKAGRP